MLVRMLGNRFRRIEHVAGNIDPNKIIIKNTGDLFNLYDRLARDESFLDNKRVYYDLAFFRGNRELCRQANKSRDIFFIWKRRGEFDAAYDIADDGLMEKFAAKERMQERPQAELPADDAPAPEDSAPEDSTTETQEQPAEIPESVLQAGRNPLRGLKPCGSFD